MGCDKIGLLVYFLSGVSIHAAQAGCDRSVYFWLCGSLRFNSRSPSGLRLTCTQTTYNVKCFNSRSPSGLRQASHLPLCTTILVSIHAAQAGCDLGISTAQHLQKGFNSRSPSGLRHAWPSSLPGESFVSIHAAQAGCDVFLAILVDVGKCFNSRSPSGLRHCHLVPRGK